MMSAASCPSLALHWLPPIADFNACLSAVRSADDEPSKLLARLQALASHRLDFTQTRRLDRVLDELAARLPPRAPKLRLAVLGDATLDHLVPGIRVGALRRGLLTEVSVGPFGQWRQQILDPHSELYAGKPDAVLLMLDRGAFLAELPLGTDANEAAETVDAAVADITALWRMLRERSQAIVIQQTIWSDEAPLFGHFERLVPAAPAAVAARLDERLAAAAMAERAVLLDLRAVALAVGARHLGDAALWHHAKQAVSPMAVPWVGDHVGRILAALRGLSKKVLVLDLDNTLWGGVIGDDGVGGIVLGQGSAAGEAFVAFQRYVKRLAGRGIVLAVSSKNDRAIAEAAFAEHPEMVLQLADFAAFEADWNDKPSAVKRVAEQLELGLDSVVFVDDNPAERDLMRRALPRVAVPELPDAPELYARCLADAGYFEAVAFTAEDAKRNDQYVANRQRQTLQTSATDMESFLRDLQMTLTVSPFRPADLPRITQLINKTNQFNLTTRRYTEAEVRAIMEDPSALTFAARLADRFGDNGLTSIVIGRRIERDSAPVVEIDTWLMSCRILGRRVEDAMLKVLAEDAGETGAAELIGRYLPTPKNGLVKDHYAKLGFAPLAGNSETGESLWVLMLANARLPAIGHVNLIRTR